MAEPNPTRLSSLDLLRFVAAMAVTLYHYVTCYPVPADAALASLSAVSAVTRYGYLGVDLFFMISGFVILWSSLNRDVTGFVISRASRLFPSFWASVAFTVACVVLLAPYVPAFKAPPLDLRTIGANLTMLPAVFKAPLLEGVYWTLEIEVRFYALIFLVLLARQMPRIEFWLYVWLGVSILALFVELPWIVQYVAITPYGQFFVAGCLFFLVSSRGLSPARSIGLIVSAAACIYSSIEQRRHFITPDTISAVIVPLLVAGFFAMFAAMTIFKRSLPSTRLGYRLGELTYPLYLTHATMGVLVYGLLRPVLGIWPTLLVITALALGVAWIVTTTVDRPARQPFANLLYQCARVFRIYKPAPSGSLR